MSCAAAGRHKIYTVLDLYNSCRTLCTDRRRQMYIDSFSPAHQLCNCDQAIHHAHCTTLATHGRGFVLFRPLRSTQVDNQQHIQALLILSVPLSIPLSSCPPSLGVQTIVVWAPARKGPQRSHGGFPAEIVRQNDGGRVWLLPPSVLCLCNCALHQRARLSL